MTTPSCHLLCRALTLCPPPLLCTQTSCLLLATPRLSQPFRSQNPCRCLGVWVESDHLLDMCVPWLWALSAGFVLFRPHKRRSQPPFLVLPGWLPSLAFFFIH